MTRALGSFTPAAGLSPGPAPSDTGGRPLRTLSRKGGGTLLERIRACTIATACATLAGGAALAHDGQHDDAPGMVSLPDAASVVYRPGPPNLPEGTRMALISGDPAKAGPFVLRIRFPADTVIAPHTHAEAETLTILSGSISHQHGKTVDKAKGQLLKAGGFVFLPKDMPHALWTAGEPVELQVNGSGPFGVNYIDPADDPSRAGAK